MTHPETKIHFIHDSWKANSFSKTGLKFKKAVGVTNSDGLKLWIPPEYRNRLEHRGYEPAKTRELSLPFDREMNIRLEDFFERIILGGLEKPHSQTPAYDCMSFAWFMAGALLKGTEVSRAMALSKEALDKQLIVEPASLGVGQITVLGGIDNTGEHFTDHAMVNLDGVKCLQVFGHRGRIIVSKYDETIELYRGFYSDELPPVSLPKPHGLFIANT